MTRISSIVNQRGVTLIEALVAMAVMAFGMLALVGVQSTLRVNADLAKQRAEATRLAEQQLESVRGFLTVGSGSGASTEYDNIGTVAAVTITQAESNTEYVRKLTVTAQGDGLHKTLRVDVTWKDRYGNDRSVVLRDVLTRSAPMLSGIVSTVKKVTVTGQRKNRHPTIPIRAGDLGDGRSAFKPQEGGTIAWVFNNATGVITSLCTVGSGVTSDQLNSPTLLTSCVDTNAQLLAGHIRFNLRGVSAVLPDGTSVYKPVPGDTAAFVIDNANGHIVKRCTVPAATASTALVLADLSGCATVDQPIATFDASDTSTYVLAANDSENALWPALNVKVGVVVEPTTTTLTSPTLCYTDAPQTAVAATTQSAVQYFCIIFASTQSWMGKSSLEAKAYTDGNGANWSIGATSNAYRVCRYTTAASALTDNLDHPADYGIWLANCLDHSTNPLIPACRPVSGNLVNQNFLVIEGSKTCPTDVPVDAASHNLVNSNTLQHQP